MKQFRYIILASLVFAAFQYANAQGPPPPPDGGGGDGTVTDVVPINFLIYPFLIIGAYIGYRFSKNSKS